MIIVMTSFHQRPRRRGTDPAKRPATSWQPVEVLIDFWHGLLIESLKMVVEGNFVQKAILL